ncbi:MULTISPECIES: urease accessory protein UreE [unclassified Geomicrobium]|uniref:urease accessory protein UreE n=1 Tax=unclassified Geomicrobium TaxID=2628951 RepID=UPI00045ED335|nr:MULTISPECIES: urease accessory protein UreE [unclassified Geomicrobium]GAJ98242.1 urease accessory protein UreE [Geomicrobium sp. JCM 19055]GAK07721.1 urease accessory protein UreE [Geomicrobium sp. JCM 19038]
MIITEVLGNIQNGHPEKEMKEWLEVEWEELNKRRMRRTTDQGREIAIKLEDAQHLHVGDVLYEDHDVQIVLRTKMEPVFVVYPKSMQEMGKASFELGNRHTPCLVEEDRITVRYDATLERLFDEIGVQYEQESQRFNAPFKYRSHHH